MTPIQVEHVQKSFELVAPIADQAAALFYSRLFELNPALKPLFGEDMVKQGRMLMQTLALAVGQLHEPARIATALQALGRRHVGYGVKEADYATVGAALLWTLEAGLGAAFTADVEAAWGRAYTLLSTVMMEAAREGQA